MISKLLNGLNPNQTQAVQSISGSTLVIAGAGSGKTAVLTRRCAYLIEKGVVPGSILSLTFTNKAAKEMDIRVRKLLTENGYQLPFVPAWQADYLLQPLLCTFHSLGVRILREYCDRLNLSPSFTILDSDDQKKIIRTILKEKNIDIKLVQPNLVVYFISQCKQEMLQADQSSRVSKEFLPIFHQIYKSYEEKLRASDTVDFDDLILLPYILLNDNSDIQNELNNRWKHIQIDEFQDTNPAQFALVKLLQPKDLVIQNNDRSMFVVGDDAQSIYGFRGSRIEIILNFGKEYPTTTEIVLNQNYRSTQPILDLAEKIISHNPFQKKKDLFTDNPETIDISYYQARNEQDEGEYIIKQIYKQYGPDKDQLSSQDEEFELEMDEIFTPTPKPAKPIHTSNDPISSMFDVFMEQDDFAPSWLSTYDPSSWQVPTYDWSSIAQLNDCVILYRTHSQSRSLEETFLKYRMPYRLVSGVKFLDRKEIKDVMAILKFVANSSDTLSLSRWLPLVWSGVGPKTLEKIIAYLQDYQYPLAPKFQSQINELFENIQSVYQNQLELIDFTKELLDKVGYLRHLKGQYPIKEEYQARLENIGELYSLMLPFQDDGETSLQVKLQRFLDQVSLMGQADQSELEDIPKINLMSLHQSKGLEFESVFMVGIEDGLLPHQNSVLEPHGLEEEVRLAYVGVTRAKRHLHLISADTRVQFGQLKSNPVSRIFRPFLDSNCKRVIKV
jgi:DNA helicase II / ATP-dependent DNA helicase PcrA